MRPCRDRDGKDDGRSRIILKTGNSKNRSLNQGLGTINNSNYSKPSMNAVPSCSSSPPRSEWTPSRPENTSRLPRLSLSTLLLKHISKLISQDDSISSEEYTIRVTSAIFLANVHYLLYARGMISFPVAQVYRQQPSDKRGLALMKNLDNLEQHMQRLVSSSHTTTVPLVLLLGPSPLSPKQIIYIEQTVPPHPSSDREDRVCQHSTLPTFIKSSLCLCLNRFLMSNIHTTSASRNEKLFVLTLQPTNWNCVGWNKRMGIKIPLHDIDNEEQEQEENTPPAMEAESLHSRTPSPFPPPPNHTPIVQSKRPVLLRQVSNTIDGDPDANVDSCETDTRPPGSRLTSIKTTTSRKSTFILRPHNQAQHPVRRIKGSKRKCTVLGYRINSDTGSSREREEESTAAMAWFQCETVLSGCT
ncbi:unnamed protein product [Sympodiomycopsis kandeliae]